MHMTTGFGPLAGHKHCQLVTFRRNGAAMPTPVWFAVHDGRLYVKTEDPSGKVRRIRNDPRVEVAPCTITGTIRGAAIGGRARLLAPHEVAVAERALRSRYGLGRRLFGLLVEPIFALRGLAPVYVEVTPAGAR
jgi:PPOX class probable F420-dependent enzyme